MKKIVMVVIALALMNTIKAQGIEFEHGTLAEALAKAKAENKMVFLDAYTTWCGPCKVMSKEVFPQKEVGDYMNANFVSLKMDMEKGEGIEMAKYFNIKAYPTLLFLKSNGNVLHTKIGGTNAQDFIAEGKKANDSTKQFWYIEKQYKEGNREISLVANYIIGLKENFNEEEVQKVGQDYMKTMPKEKYNTEDGFTILGYTGTTFRSDLYLQILNNQKLYANTDGIGQESVDYVLSNAIGNYVSNIAKTGTLDELKLAIEKTKEDYISKYQKQVEFGFYNEYYLANKLYSNYFDANKKEADEETDDRMHMSKYINLAYGIAVNPALADAGLDERAIKLIEESVVAVNPESLSGYFCLASLYKKAGNKQKALENVNAYMQKNKAKGVENDKRVNDLKASIEQM